MKTSGRALQLRQTVKHAVLGAAGVAAIVAVCFPLHTDVAICGCCCLLLVVLQSTVANFAASALVSVIAIACLDYFFVPPVFTLNIDRAEDGWTLLTFLVTSLVITRLASRAREEGRKAGTRRKDLARLYELASRLVSASPVVAVERRYLGVFRDIFDLQSVCLFDATAAAASCDGESHHNLTELTKQSYISGRDYDNEEARIAVRCLRNVGRPIGAVGFEGLHEAESTAGSLAALAAAMVQRARSFEIASEAAAATQIEMLRSAVLDAFAHQFKTPLAAILTAAGSLRETGPLVPQQHEMVETIEDQAVGLGNLTTRLLRMARLDRDEIKPRMQSINLSAMVGRLAEQCRNQADGHAVVLQIGEKPVEAPADSDILSLAIIQLLDNAFRYSPPTGAITVCVSSEDVCAMVRVTNEGSPILPEEQDRIFDRFYRGAAARQSSGTGLGLYVARKIVVAHGGTLDLDKDRVYGKGTTFCLRLPVAKDECKHELKAS
jgi:two-component system, OmpR family, sensor histidine kinase KdpD